MVGDLVPRAGANGRKATPRVYFVSGIAIGVAPNDKQSCEHTFLTAFLISTEVCRAEITTAVWAKACIQTGRRGRIQ